MLLEIALRTGTQFIVQVIEDQVGHLSAGLVGQSYLPAVSFRHAVRLLMLLNAQGSLPVYHAKINGRDEAASLRLKQ